MKILDNISDDLLSPSEQKRWRLEYDQLHNATDVWSKKSSVAFTPEELHYLTILNNPKFWAAETLKWYARDYQEPMLYEMANSKRTVLRLGRRLGKTETMCIMILWHAFAQPNKGPNNQYNVLIIAPFEKQVDLIFDRLSQLIDLSSDIKTSRDIHHRLELPNGTIITGMTAGSKSGNGAANTRGQRADLIVLDEVDYMGESEITNIQNIRNEAPERIKMIVASTPAGKRDSYYKWCTGATKTYAYDADGTIKKKRVAYKMIMKPYRMKSDGSYAVNSLGDKIRDGNGWTTIHAPSTVNPELLKVNPDTGLTYIEELQLDLTEMRFTQEVLAEFGESMSGVFLKKHIDFAVERGRELKLDYVTHAKQRPNVRNNPRILGVDWDKSKADTNMVGVEWDPDIKAFIPFYRKVIARGEWTYTNAVEEIKRADKEFQFDYIMIDAGHGEYQIEELRKYEKDQQVKGGVGAKMIRVNLSEKVKVWDPIMKAYEKKHIKPFMVNNAVLMFERGMVALNPSDKDTISQFESYEVKSWGSDGRPTYTDENEHILDCVVFALYGFTKYYDDILKVTKSSRIALITKPLDRTTENVSERSMRPAETMQEKKSKRLATSLGLSTNPNRRERGSRAPARRSTGMPTRKSF